MTVKISPNEVRGNTFTFKFHTTPMGDCVTLHLGENPEHYFIIRAFPLSPVSYSSLEDLLETVFAAYELALARRVSP